MAKSVKKTTKKAPVKAAKSVKSAKTAKKPVAAKTSKTATVAKSVKASKPAPAAKTSVKKVAKAPARETASAKKVAAVKKVATGKKVAKKAQPKKVSKAAKVTTAKPKAKVASGKPAKVATPQKDAAKSAAKKAPAKKAPAKKAPAKKSAKAAKAVEEVVEAPRKQPPPKPAPSGLSFLAGKPGSSGNEQSEIIEKPHLTVTKLPTKDLERFRDLLHDHRRRLLGDIEGMEKEALQGEGSNLSTLPLHMADMGTDNYEQEFTLSLADRGRRVIEEIDHALNKIESNTYGICEGTGQMIAKARLQAQPWVRYSIEYARNQGRHNGRRA